MFVSGLPSQRGRFISMKVPSQSAPPGYKWVYEVNGLSGLGKFKLRKIIRSVARVATAPIRAIVIVSKKIVKSKAFKKLAPIALVATGAYFAAPWFITLAKTIGTGAAQMLLKQRAPTNEPMTADESAKVENELTSNQMPDWISGPAEAYIEQKKRKSIPSYYDQAARDDTEISPQTRQIPQQFPNESPKWVIPAAIGGAALLLLTTR